jgi:DHA1 family bicyclomycin/chloramphenicol resistance-like MFS transporter
MEKLTAAEGNARPGRLFIILLLGSLMTVSPFSIDMYLPAFSQIAKDLGSTQAKIALSISSYFLGLALGQLFYGPLLDRYGRKRPLYFGLVVYIVSCILCIQSKTLEMLVVVRFIQALGGGVALVAAIAMVRDFFPVDESAKIFSLLMLMLGLSPLLAPTIGGYVATWLGWHWVFILLAIIVSLILALIFLFLPEGHEPDPEVSLKARNILGSFFSILRNRSFFSYTFAGAFSFAPIFVYVAGSPIIFMGIFHVSPEMYGGIFALIAVGFIGSNQINIFLLRKFTPAQIFRTALLCQFLISIVFLFGAWRGWFGLQMTIVLFFVSLSFVGLTYPNASALALAPFSSNAGTASAMITFLQIGISALVSSCVGLLNPDNAVPIVAMMACASLVAVLIFAGGVRGGSKRI